MSRRNRRERRARQQERAVASGDVAAIEQLTQKSLGGAAAAAARALTSPPADPAQAAQLDALSARLARQLRRSGEADKALALAAAGKRRTPELRLEEAVAAFAAGHDDVAAAIAVADALVAAAVGPLLQATRGEAIESTSSPALKPLHAAARATAAVVRGEIDRARAVIHRIPHAQRAAVLGEEIAAAAALHDPANAARGFETLSRSAPLARRPEVQRTAAAEMIFDAPTLDAMPKDIARDPIVKRRALRLVFSQDTPLPLLVDVVGAMGPDPFDEADRAAATLYQGFALARADPARAAAAFDRAVQLGADMIEALRGKTIALRHAAHRLPDGSGERRKAARNTASAADRLAHALARLPRGGPLAAAAGAIAAEAWLEGSEPHAATTSIKNARPHAGGKLVDTLDLLEADAIAFRDMKEAERRVDAVIARSPDNRQAWDLKQQMLVAQGDHERAAQLVVDAAAATQDPGLVEEAREIQGQRGDLAPFQGMSPGSASPGALARELARAMSEELDPTPLAAKHREALAPAGQLAFDVAAIVVAGEQGTEGMAKAQVERALRAWQHHPRELQRVVAAAVVAGCPEAVVQAVGLTGNAGALRAAAEALAAAEHGKLAARLLPRFAADLTRTELAYYQSVLRTPRRVAKGVPDPDAVLEEIDRTLAPEMSLADYLEEDLEDDDVPGEDIGDAALAMAFDMLGIPGSVFTSMSREARAEMAVRLTEIFARESPSPASQAKIERIFADFGIEIRLEPIHGARRRR